ncbi:MAG: sensor histidine kinase, partial [Faecalibacillus sp.]
MKFIDYMKDKLYAIILFFMSYFILLLIFLVFHLKIQAIIACSFVLYVFFILVIAIDYLRKKDFYNHLIINIERLDKAYLVLETLKKPSFYEGKLIVSAMYEINKSMAENVKTFEKQMNSFKEYIEMWIHEVKIPISSLVLMAHNHKTQFDLKSREQIRRIENYVEQVLYYVRSENAEKDYLINEISLEKVINQIAIKNKDDFLENKIDFLVEDVDFTVYSDSKWLEFMLNQIINNSIKYKSGHQPFIQIKGKEKKNKIILTIKDNGIGIAASDLSRVFDKSFTGINGRKQAKSTGMGLYICKNLCKKLGHQIQIESKQGEYTQI